MHIDEMIIVIFVFTT